MWGYDAWDTTGCHGQQWHVLASCTVNGTAVAPASHYYFEHQPDGACLEIYGWHDVVVDLGQPGPVDIALRADNSRHVGGVGIHPWQVWTVGDPPPDFEIVSATFDKSVYRNGVDTAQLTVVTRSNWGSGSVQLAGTLTASTQQTYPIGPDSFSLTPGQTHNSHLAFAVPTHGDFWSFSANLSLGSGGAPADTLQQANAFYGVPGLLIVDSELTPATAEAGDTLQARFRIAQPDASPRSVICDVRLSSQSGTFELAPYSHTALLPNGVHELTRPAILPNSAQPATYSCNWVLNDAQSGAYLTATGWRDGALVVTAPTLGPVLAISQSHIEFGDVAIGQSSSRPVYLTNSGDETLTVAAVEVGDPAFVGDGTDQLPWVLAPGASRTVAVRFTPNEDRGYSSLVRFHYNGHATQSADVQVEGNGISPLAGYLVIDGMQTSSHFMGQDYDPPIANCPAEIELTTRNPGDTPYSGELRAVVLIGDLYGQGIGDRFWTGLEGSATTVQTEAFTADDNPTLRIAGLGPDATHTIHLKKVDHWLFAPPQDFMYRKPDFSEMVIVNLYQGEELIGTYSLDLSDGFSVSMSPEAYINCASEILGALNAPMPVKLMFKSAQYGPPAAVLMGEMFTALNADPPDHEAASEAFVNLVDLSWRYALQAGLVIHSAPGAWIIFGVMNEFSQNGCGVLIGSGAEHLRAFVADLIRQLGTAQGEQIGNFMQYGSGNPGEVLRVIVEVTGGQGASLTGSRDRGWQKVAARDGGSNEEPFGASLPDQYLAVMPADSLYSITLLGQATDSLDLWQMYRRPDGSLVKLFWDGMPMRDGSRAHLQLGSGVQDFAFQVDQEGDGVVDFTWPPAFVEIRTPSAPDPVTQFTVLVDDSTHTIGWVNPTSTDFKGVRVVVGTPECPVSATGGGLAVNDSLGAPGELRSFAITGMDPRLSYCYRAYAYDAQGNFSPPSKATGNRGCRTLRRIPRSPRGWGLRSTRIRVRDTAP